MGARSAELPDVRRVVGDRRHVDDVAAANHGLVDAATDQDAIDEDHELVSSSRRERVLTPVLGEDHETAGVLAREHLQVKPACGRESSRHGHPTVSEHLVSTEAAACNSSCPDYGCTNQKTTTLQGYLQKNAPSGDAVREKTLPMVKNHS